MSWDDTVRARNEATHDVGRWRTVRTLADGALNTKLLDAASDDAHDVVVFATNDYLGLSQHPAVRQGALDAIQRFGAGAGASRLVVGGRPIHDELETAIAESAGTDAALLFPTGFAANMGLIGTLATCGDVTVHSDELNHASIIDGARLAHAEVSVFRHLDLDHLEANLATHRDRRNVVVTDSVFSMDGDLAPIDALVDLCARHDAFLLLDEAHAVLSPYATWCADRQRGASVAVVGTLSKTIGALGGYVAGSRDLIDLCINTARSFIFTTAPSPANCGAALAAFDLLHGPEGAELTARLRANVERLSPGNPSPIIPVIVGGEADAVAASRALLDRGLLVPAIRPPTVAPDTSRLRVALSALHRPEDVDRLRDALDDLGLIHSLATSHG